MIKASIRDIFRLPQVTILIGHSIETEQSIGSDTIIEQSDMLALERELVRIWSAILATEQETIIL
jgi:hypothetical protein